MLTQALGSLRVRAPTPGLFDITEKVSGWLDSQRIADGLLTLFCAHTSASLVIQENTAQAARHDLERFFERIAPEDPALYTHNDEGPDDMPAHIRSALTQTELTIPVQAGAMALGTWQGIFLFEHRQSPPDRRIALHLIGEGE
ncbi:secondary thiamine-phosphate synthase enzyme YjbQ [Sphingomonas sp. RG327]|uniref:Secondary thiamine-phosphate synthase enzyme YjbQ n=1 Tax=Sphingomonas anseongensis TaxID=2908207 RepID=A0ABT0RDD5_9SPHN|nr:secondary thiamine-phosphate synthase enzyme YjbQ [Sphingomonas anseongensis]MCL6678253.1 secondary thiamine-phosphate synthase enzyme YjbQ [Sphingomonas anseongensis]